MSPVSAAEILARNKDYSPRGAVNLREHPRKIAFFCAVIAVTVFFLQLNDWFCCKKIAFKSRAYFFGDAAFCKRIERRRVAINFI